MTDNSKFGVREYLPVQQQARQLFTPEIRFDSIATISNGFLVISITVDVIEFAICQNWPGSKVVRLNLNCK